MSKRTSRRNFLKTSAFSLGFLGLQAYVAGCKRESIGYGELQPDPEGLLRLPEGFRYVAFSKTGERMDDGLFVPGAHDGMAAFPGPDGNTILVRNHEMGPGRPDQGPFGTDHNLHAQYFDKLYDPADKSGVCSGGTTTLVFDTAKQELTQHSLSLAGTLRNCSGGPTPWGSWITCEETVLRAGEGPLEHDHGYCFEVPASSEMGLALPVPIKEMGRYNHEAVAVDPRTSIVYLTEDRPDGLLYRFLPNTPGNLRNGGKLQALAILEEPSRDTRNWPKSQQEPFPLQSGVSTVWVDLEDIDSPADDLRYRGYSNGAARFARGEGMVFGNGAAYFACTNGGPKQFGQIFKYTPSDYEGTEEEKSQPGTLELFVESTESKLMKACDNLTVAPWGDVIICEDDGPSSAIVGVTPQAELYHIAHIDIKSEMAGACFSPDGSTLFVNVQRNPGLTLAITGPWKS